MSVISSAHTVFIGHKRLHIMAEDCTVVPDRLPRKNSELSG